MDELLVVTASGSGQPCFRCPHARKASPLALLSLTVMCIALGHPVISLAQDFGAVEREQAAPLLSIPSPTDMKQVLVDLKEIFRTEYAAATTPQARLALSRQLMAQADKASKPSERWVLLSEAMRLASDAGDMELCFEAITKSAAQFDIDADELKLDSLSKLATKAPPQQVDGLARTAIEVAKKAADSGNSAILSKSLALATSLARKTKNRALIAEATKIQQSARDQEKESKELAAVAAKLAQNPAHADVCLEAGKFLCFKAEDWDRGLPLLAKGSDTALARLAVAEMNAGKTTEAVTSLADAWWDWGDKERGATKSAGLGHAANLYGSVLAKTQGLDRARLEKRIKQAQSDSPNRGKRVALADLNEESATGMQYAFAKDGTFKGAPFTCCGQPWPKGLTAMT